MSTLHFLSSAVPHGATPRCEPLLELDSVEENPCVYVWRKTHPPHFVFRKELIFSKEVQELTFSITGAVIQHLQKLFLDPQVQMYRERGLISIDVSESIQTTAQRMVNELREQQRKFQKRGKGFCQRRIDLLLEGEKALTKYFQDSIKLKIADPQNLNDWIAQSTYSLFRMKIEKGALKVNEVNTYAEKYFESLKPDQARLDRFLDYKQRFRLVKYPDIGDTVWYCGGQEFLQGVVLEDGQIQTEVKQQQRAHALFDVEEEYGREVVFLRPHFIF